MARKPTGRKPRRGNDGNGAFNLINALKFVSLAQRKEGNPHHMHCVFYGGYVTAFDGLLTIGHPIEEDITACPDTFKMLTALLKCGEQLTITQLDSGRLSIKSDKFKALIPCADFQQMPYVGPDQQCAVINDSIKTGLEIVSPVVNENETRTALRTILLQANTLVATNGHLLLEYWHGIDLPPNILIPKESAKALIKAGKKLIGFGFSNHSATFFYEDRSYIKTQLVEDQYVSYRQLFENETLNHWPLPADFYKAVDILESISEDGLLYFDEGLVRTHRDPNEGASYELAGVPANMIFNAEYLQMAKPAFQNVDFKQLGEAGSKAFFYGDNIRGALMGCRPK